MSKKKECGSKQHLEAIFGSEIDLEFPDQVVVIRDTIATYTEQDGRITSRETGTTGSSTKRCTDTSLLEVSGIARTGEHGTVELKLRDFFCADSDDLRFKFPAIVVATPRTQSPAFMTAQASPTSNRMDVAIKFAMWDESGTPTPRLFFNWICRVPTYNEVIID